MLGFFYFWLMRKTLDIRQIYVKNRIFRELVSSLSLLVFLYSILIFLLNEFYNYNYYQIPFHFAFFFLLVSIYVGTRNYITFDFETGSIESTITFGIIKWKKIKRGADFDYFSLVRNEAIFELNIWRKDNSHQRFYTFQNYGEALKFGMMVSKKLDMKLLDATDLSNKKWIETTEI